MACTRVGLALSGGAARGAAHVGVLQVLEREGIPIDCIAGTSAGSVVGALYAAGMDLDHLVQLALSLRWRQVTRVVWPSRGLLTFAPMEAFLARLLGDPDFNDLRIPFATVAADLESSSVMVLSEGRLAPAVRASCSIPGFVTPARMDGRLLADGGVANNLPISVARKLGAEIVIAVNLMIPLGRQPRGLVEISTAALETLIARASDDPASADVYIPVPLRGAMSYVRLSEAPRHLAVGREAAEKALPAIRAALG